MGAEDVRKLVDSYIEEARAEADKGPLARLTFFHKFKPGKLRAGEALLALPREAQALVVLDVVPRQVELINGPNRGSDALKALLSGLLRKSLPFTLAQLETLVRTIAMVKHTGYWECVAPSGIMLAVGEYAESHELPGSLRTALEALVAELRKQTYYVEPRKLADRIDGILRWTNNQQPPDATEGLALPEASGLKLRPDFGLSSGEAWTSHLSAALAGMEGTNREPWRALLAHCATATTSKPSNKWLNQAEPLVGALGADAFKALVISTLAEIGKPGTPPKAWIMGQAFDGDPTVVHNTHSDLLRGLVWCTSLVPEDRLIAAVGDAADICFKKIPNVGPRAPKIGNACLVALSRISTPAAVAQLTRLKSRAKHVSIQKQLGRAMDAAAEQTGMSAAELEEVAVPNCGLTGVGEFRKQLGDVTARINLANGLRAEISWLKVDGKAQQSAPASVKETFADEVKAIKAQAKEIDKLLPAQRDRIERLFAQPRSWQLADFRQRYLDHPLVGVFARRLIWRLGDTSGIFSDGRFVDRTDRPIEGLSESTCVSLWHPIDAEVLEVKTWRDWLGAHQVRQPFKQAHREIYILTDAERATQAYSNRFAAHILKQHQFAALCHQRGWRYGLQGNWDSANTPSLALPQWDLRAEFLIEAIEAGEGPHWERTDTAHSGIYLYLSTDQVRFCRLEDNIPLPLAEVPPLAFTEVMRDVDLFVGVASVGNDPNWRDGGPLGRYRDYWQEYSFGELFPSAQTRKEVLEQIVPRLKIADRCSFTDRFLVVKGNLRTYKIHLGSGNILMSPNDQYLCIVPSHGAAPGAGKVYLPFEGDRTLSIILSKAFLLAEDTKIKDSTITGQLALRGP
jgi:hypothetical protein